MSLSVLKILPFSVVIFFIAASVSIAQEVKENKSCCNKETKKTKDDSNHTMIMDSTKSGHQSMDMKNHQHGEESIIREGEIDLKRIDENKDGKVYQDQMDWNVISDEPGECPLCGMKLKEVILENANEKLLKHGFKVLEE